MIPYVVAGLVSASGVSGAANIPKTDCRKELREAIVHGDESRLEAAFGCYTAAISEADSLSVDMVLGHRLAAVRMLEGGDSRYARLEEVMQGDFVAAGAIAQEQVLKYARGGAQQSLQIVRVLAVDQLAAQVAYELGSHAHDPTAVPGFAKADALQKYNAGVPFEVIKKQVASTMNTTRAEEALRLIDGTPTIPGLESVYVDGTAAEFRAIRAKYLQAEGKEL